MSERLRFDSRSLGTVKLKLYIPRVIMTSAMLPRTAVIKNGPCVVRRLTYTRQVLKGSYYSRWNYKSYNVKSQQCYLLQYIAYKVSEAIYLSLLLTAQTRCRRLADATEQPCARGKFDTW